MRLLRIIADLWFGLRYQWLIKQGGWHPDDIDRHGAEAGAERKEQWQRKSKRATQ